MADYPYKATGRTWIKESRAFADRDSDEGLPKNQIETKIDELATSSEEIQDVVGTLLVGSGATTVTYDDAAGTLTIDSTDTNTDTNTQAFSLATSGSATLSAGSAVVDTGVATDTDHYSVSFDPGAADIAASLDGSGTNYQLHFDENTTAVGTPTVGWQLLRSEL